MKGNDMNTEKFTILDAISYKEAKDLGTCAIEDAFSRVIKRKAITDFDEQMRDETLANLFCAYAYLSDQQIRRNCATIERREAYIERLTGEIAAAIAALQGSDED